MDKPQLYALIVDDREQTGMNIYHDLRNKLSVHGYDLAFDYRQSLERVLQVLNRQSPQFRMPDFVISDQYVYLNQNDTYSRRTTNVGELIVGEAMRLGVPHVALYSALFSKIVVSEDGGDIFIKDVKRRNPSLRLFGDDNIEGLTDSLVQDFLRRNQSYSSSISDIEAFYDRIAAEYIAAQRAFYSSQIDSSRRDLYNHLDRSLAGKTIVDIGCGFGGDVAELIKRGADYYAIDCSQEMLKIARSENPDLSNRFIHGDFHHTPFQNEKFDMIFSRYALHYSHNPAELFQELGRILKPQGTVVFVAAHPLLGFINKSRRIYWERDIVSISLFDDKVMVEEPTHTFADWISPFVLRHFDVETFIEHEFNDNQPSEVTSIEQVPDYFLMKLRKKK